MGQGGRQKKIMDWKVKSTARPQGKGRVPSKCPVICDSDLLYFQK